MKSDHWFAVSRNLTSKLVYLIKGSDLDEVASYAKTMYANPIVLPLTWRLAGKLTGCIIPCDKDPSDEYHGPPHLPRQDVYEIIVKVL